MKMAAAIGLTAAVAMCVFCICGLVLQLQCRSHFEHEAIGAGAAFYQCDKDTGDCVFQWKSNAVTVP